MIKPANNALGNILIAVLISTLCHGLAAAESELEDLGRQLFFDLNLSANRTMSCATCHDPAHAFTDKRTNSSGNAVSLGDDGMTPGLRNTPSLTYIAFAPDFHQNELGEYIGGVFYDGRALNLETQVTVPILDQREMGMHDVAMMRQRIEENNFYASSFRQLFGGSVFDTDQAIINAVSKAVAAFERTAYFSTFDSKYDRYIAGEYTLTTLESLGRKMYFSQLQNCNVCHQLHFSSDQSKETFSNYQFHNIGVPPNPELMKLNGSAHYPDRGLLHNPAIEDPNQEGKFRVPSLRNSAVTAPYMHNGVFRDLRTVIQFYNQYLIANESSLVNPETGENWAQPENIETLDLDLLQQGQPIQGRLMEALLAFLHILTDSRYEHLLTD